MKTLKQAFAPIQDNTIRVIAQGEKGRIVLECGRDESIGQDILKIMHDYMSKEKK